MPEKKTRRLVAIMFTDIQGYTALMQQSEAEAIRVREVHREIFNSNTEQFHGEIIQYYGDGTLSIFESAVDAVQCGIAMQHAFQQEPQIPIRIGIHAGDIVLNEEDIIGDAVNIASRVESLAVPGGVLISDKVFDEIKNKDAIQTTSLGKFKFKNVKHSVGVYAISNEGLIVPSKKAITGKLEKEKKITWPFILGFVVGILFLSIWGYRSLQTEPPDVPLVQSIVVLPFDNFTGKTDLDYFIQGMHSSLIGDLGQISALRVISPTTARAYKNAGKSIPEIAAELNVDAVMEVSVHCLGDSICILPRLLTVHPEERQIWAQKYNEEKSQILNLYQNLTKAISQQINVTLTPEEESRMAETRTVDTVAYALYLRGQIYLDQINPTSLNAAFQYFKRATEIDRDWGDPYAGLAMVAAYQAQMNILSPSEAVPEIHRNLDIALDLAPYSANAYLAKAITAVWSEWNWEKGEAAFLKSLELDPNNALCRMFYAHLLSILRRNEEALQQSSIAQGLDPLRPFLLGLYGSVLWSIDQCEAAVPPLEKALFPRAGSRFCSECTHSRLGVHRELRKSL